MFKRLAVGLGALVLSLLGPMAAPAYAQGISQKVAVCDPKFVTRCAAPNASGALPITGTITASLGALNPTGSATLATTTTTARVALPSADPTLFVRNPSTTVDAYLKLGNGSVVATTTPGSGYDLKLPAGWGMALNVGAGTNLAAITSSGSVTLELSTGTGLPAVTGGGGGGSGGGGAITAASGSYAAGAFAIGAGADGWNITLGSKADTATCATTNTAMSCFRQLHADVTAPIPTQAPTVDIGAVGISQTTPGTTNGVVAKAAAVGGATPSVAAALSTTVTAIKASAGSLYGALCYNPNASVEYVQAFNVASGSVTLGTTVATVIIPVPATSNGGLTMSAVPIAFPTAMAWAATTTPTGSTAPGTALTCTALYN